MLSSLNLPLMHNCKLLKLNHKKQFFYEMLYISKLLHCCIEIFQKLCIILSCSSLIVFDPCLLYYNSLRFQKRLCGNDIALFLHLLNYIVLLFLVFARLLTPHFNGRRFSLLSTHGGGFVKAATCEIYISINFVAKAQFT